MALWIGDMNVRYKLFLSLGLERENQKGPPVKKREVSEKLMEPDGARACRRNILALGGIVVLAGFADVDPSDLSVFGVKPSGDWGVRVLGVAIILAHLYWYFLRYFHMKEDGTHGHGNLRISQNNFHLVHKSADLFANRVAFFMTILSWYFVASWMIGFETE